MNNEHSPGPWWFGTRRYFSWEAAHWAGERLAKRRGFRGDRYRLKTHSTEEANTQTK